MTVRSRCVEDNLVVTLDASVVRSLPFDPTTPLQARVENGEIVLRPAEVAPEVALVERLGIDGDVGDLYEPNTDVTHDFADSFKAEFEALLRG